MARTAQITMPQPAIVQVKPVVNSALGAMDDIGCMVERLEALYASATADLHEVIPSAPEGGKWIEGRLYSVGMILTLANEKYAEIRDLLDALDDRLRIDLRYSDTDQHWDSVASAFKAAHDEVGRSTGVPAEVMNRLTNIEEAALSRLLATPAPNRRAVAMKINAFLDCRQDCELEPEILRAIAADADREQTA